MGRNMHLPGVSGRWVQIRRRDAHLHPYPRGRTPPRLKGMSVLVWTMIALAFWHFTVLVPDRFWGGIVGALFVALAGAYATGFLLPTPGVPAANPPGLGAALWPTPGTLLALGASYAAGRRAEES
jgi:hypothetical protein